MFIKNKRIIISIATPDSRRNRSAEHDVRAKQAKACDAELTGFSNPSIIL